MYICPKCGKYMTWYMKYYCGVPFGGWTCGCGYDTNLWSNTIATNRTICYGECAARKTENSSEKPNSSTVSILEKSTGRILESKYTKVKNE